MSYRIEVHSLGRVDHYPSPAFQKYVEDRIKKELDKQMIPSESVEILFFEGCYESSCLIRIIQTGSSFSAWKDGGTLKEALENSINALEYQPAPTVQKDKIKSDIARRQRTDQWTPAEKAIQNAVDEIEKVGADIRLTKAVNLLMEARNLVADVVDGVSL